MNIILNDILNLEKDLISNKNIKSDILKLEKDSKDIRLSNKLQNELNNIIKGPTIKNISKLQSELKSNKEKQFSPSRIKQNIKPKKHRLYRNNRSHHTPKPNRGPER